MQPGKGLLPKRGLREGDQLVLTKPLGTGVIFAAHMQSLADGRHVRAATDCMLQGSDAAARLALEHDSSACTDVTGFGLLGHLGEMLQPGQQVRLSVNEIPALPGAARYLDRGIRSSAHAENAAAALVLLADAEQAPLLLDPQTSGGLLIAVDLNIHPDFELWLREKGFDLKPFGILKEKGEHLVVIHS